MQGQDGTMKPYQSKDPFLEYQPIERNKWTGKQEKTRRERAA